MPNGWCLAQISDIALKGQQRKPEPDEEFIYVDIGSIDRVYKRITKPQRLKGGDAPSRARKVINTGNVLVSLTRPNLNAVALVTKEYDNQIASTGFEVIKPILADSRYVFALVRSKAFVDAISGAVQGALYPAAKSSDVQAFVFPLAPIAEQKIISNKLDNLLTQAETIKARLERIPKILKGFRQSILMVAVSGKLTNTVNDYKRIKVEDTWSHDVEGPNHWKRYKLSDVIRIIGGSQPPKSEFKLNLQEGYIRLIQIRDYKSEDHKVYVPIEKVKRFVIKDDVMIGRYGPPIFQILRGLEGAYNVALMKAEPNADLIDKEYLYWYLQNYKLYNYIEAGSDRTAGQSGVNKKHLESYPILLPPLEEQAEIVRRIEQLAAYADTIEKQVNKALAQINHLTESILAKAFRGEITANWRADNPGQVTGENSAKALLTQIKTERTRHVNTKQGPKR